MRASFAKLCSFLNQPICSLWFWWVVVRIWRAVRLRSWAKFGRRREWSPRRRGCRRIWLPEGGKRLPDARAQCGTIRPSATGSAEWNWWMMKINLFYPIIGGIYILGSFSTRAYLLEVFGPEDDELILIGIESAAQVDQQDVENRRGRGVRQVVAGSFKLILLRYILLAFFRWDNSW